MNVFMLWQLGHRAWRFGKELSGSICHGTMWSTSQTKWPFISWNSAPAKVHRPNGSAHLWPWAAMTCLRRKPWMQRGPDHVMRPSIHLRHSFSRLPLSSSHHVRATSQSGAVRTLGVLRRGTESGAPRGLPPGPGGRPARLRGSAGGRAGACRGR